MITAENLGVLLAAITLIATIIYARKQIKIAKEQVDIAKRQTEEEKKIVQKQKNQIEKTEELFSNADEYLENVFEVFNKAKSIIAEEYKTDNEIDIVNMGLDLETVVPWFNELIENPLFDNILIRYKGLIINPESENIKNLINDGSNIKASIVNASLENIKELKNSGYTGIDVEVRSYSILPLFHGFIIDKKHLFLSFTEINNHKMTGGKFPYIYIKIDYTSKLNAHLFNMFLSWFSLIWDSSEIKIKFVI